MILVHVKLSTTLREAVPGYNPVAGLEILLPPCADIRQLAGQIGLPVHDVKIVMLNGTHASLDAPLANGDRVAFFPAVGGG